MKRLLQAFSLGVLALLLGVSWAGSVQATLKYKKETGKKCVFCHTGIPKPGDEDPQLSEDGKEFKRNGYRLTEEQRKKPDR